MICLSQDDVQKWLASHCRLPDALWPVRLCTGYPVSPAQHFMLAKSILDWFPQSESLLVVGISSLDVFAGPESTRLAELVRKGLGEARPIHESPGHLFSRDDRAELECLLDICLLSLWDCFLVDESNTCEVSLSRDEFVDLKCTKDLETGARSTIAYCEKWRRA